MTPNPLVFKSRADFHRLRSLRNSDGTWMRIYFRETAAGPRSAIGAIGAAILKRWKLFHEQA